MIRAWLVASLFFLMACHVYSAGRDAFSFLMISPAPRASAMGEAFVSVAQGPETVFYNPAGLAQMDDIHYYFQSYVPPFLEDIKYSNIVYAHPTKKGAFAIQAGFLHAGGFTRTVADSSNSDGYRQTGDFSTYDAKFSLNMARFFTNRLSLGISLAGLRESLGDASANSASVDVGALFYISPALQTGFSMQNYGLQTKFRDDTYELPHLFRFGVSATQLKEADVHFLPNSSIATLEFVKPVRDDASIQGGLEIPFFDVTALRAGYKYSIKKQELDRTFPSGLTLGIGFSAAHWEINYSMVSRGDLGLLHNVSIDLIQFKNSNKDQE